MRNKEVLGIILLLVGIIFIILTSADAIAYYNGVPTILTGQLRFILFTLSVISTTTGLVLVD